MTDEPLIPGPLYGLRTWRVVADEEGAERLAAPHRGTTWPTGEWLVATCERHKAPAAGCDCGVHAWHPRRASARRVLATHREVPGIVEARGATEVHEEGFRAERARPHALVLVPGRNARQVRRLAAAYGVDVVELRGPRALLAWCRERGLGMDEAVVAQLIGPGEHEARRRKARRNGLRLGAALAVVAAVVVAGSQLIPDPPPGKVLKGRGGEIRTP